jgi:glycosyltransferase involved in cell wall biosynthesis
VEFLDESLTSVKNQTYSNWEVLIGVNGWEVNSDVFKRAWDLADRKVQVLDMETTGKSDTLNAMLEYASFDVACLLDVDDWWLPSKLERQIFLINEFDVVGTWCQYFGDRSDSPALPAGEINSKIFMHVNPIINSSSMFAVGDAHWDKKYEGVEDYEMWLRLNHEKKTFFNIGDKLVYHRIHKKSAFNTKVYNLEELRKLWPV